MSERPTYRFHCKIVDEATGETVIADYCQITSIDQFGACESVDMHVASMLRAFERKARAEHEIANQPFEPVEG